jgi:hypothetical protein
MLCLENDSSIKNQGNIENQSSRDSEELFPFIPSSLDEDVTKKLLRHFTHLYRNGEIDAKAFTAIASIAMSIYIEQKIERKVDNILRSKFDETLSRLIRIG